MMRGLITDFSFHKESEDKVSKNINQTEILIMQTRSKWKTAWKPYLTSGTEVLKRHVPHPNIIFHSLPFLSVKKTAKNNCTAKPKGSTLSSLTLSTSLQISF